MPLESIVVSVLVVAAFGLFAGVLAYGEYQTRHIHRPAEPAAAAEPVEPRWREAA